MLFAGFSVEKTKPAINRGRQVPETETGTLLSAVWHKSRRMIACEAETLHGGEQGRPQISSLSTAVADVC